MFSEQEGKHSGLGWHRALLAEEITYLPCTMHKPPKSSRAEASPALGPDPDTLQLLQPSDFYYILSFSLTFLHEDDVVYLAQSYPYPYSFLRESVQRWSSNTNRVCAQPLCRTLNGNICDVLTITDFSHNPASLTSRPVSELALFRVLVDRAIMANLAYRLSAGGFHHGKSSSGRAYRQLDGTWSGGLATV